MRGRLARLTPATFPVLLGLLLVNLTASGQEAIGESTPEGAPRIEPDKCLQLAQRLETLGYHDEAITEYKRYLYFHPDSAETESCVLAIANAYRDLAQYEAAAKALRRAMAIAHSDSVRDQRRVDEAVLLLAMGRTDRARFQLSRVRSYTSEPVIKDRANTLLALAAVQDYQWEEARRSLGELEARFASRSLATVDSLLIVAANAPRKSPSKARRLSTFLPGTGQLYAGKPIEGIHSFGLNAFFGTLLTTSMIAGDYAVGVGLYFQFFYRYYVGGIYHAGLLAEERNRAEATDRQESVTEEMGRLVHTLPESSDR